MLAKLWAWLGAEMLSQEIDARKQIYLSVAIIYFPQKICPIQYSSISANDEYASPIHVLFVCKRWIVHNFWNSSTGYNIVGAATSECMNCPYGHFCTSSDDSRSLAVTVLIPNFQRPLPVRLSLLWLYWKWHDHFHLHQKWCSWDNSALEKQLAITQGMYGMNWMLPTFLGGQKRRLQKKRRAKEITPKLLYLPWNKKECLGDHSRSNSNQPHS